MIAVVSCSAIPRLAPLTLLMVLLLLSPAPAAAHAELLVASPMPGSAVAVFPDEISLTFSETVDPSLSELLLLAADGTSVELAAIKVLPADAHVLVATPTAGEAPAAGTYTLVWSAYSTEDDHVSSGSFSFSVGTGVAPDQSVLRSTDAAAAAIVGKWLELIGVVLLTGVALLVGTVKVSPPIMSARPLAALLVLASVGLIGSLVSFRARQSATSETTFVGPLNAGAAETLLDTTYGRAWLVRVFALSVVVVFVLLGRRIERRGVPLAIAALGVIALISIAASGHAMAIDPAVLAVAVDVLHMTGAAVWLGGLLGLLLVSNELRSSEWSLLIRSQERRLQAAVLLIVVSGGLAVWWQVGGRRQLASSEYGQTVLIKVAIVLALLGVAVYSRRVLHGERPRLLWVPSAMGLELILGMVVLLFSADLSQTVPANQPLSVVVAARAIELDVTDVAGASTVRLSGTLSGDPADLIEIEVAPSAGVQRVIVRTALSEPANGASIGDRFDAEAVPGASGRYTLPGGRLGIAGEWQLEISVRRAGVEDDVVSFVVDTTGLDGRGTVLVADWWGGIRPTTHTALALGLAMLMLVLGLAGLKRITGLEPLASGFLLAASLLIAGGFLVSGARGLVPSSPEHETANPSVPNSADLTYAGELYRSNCLSCHGADGAGAGNDNRAHLHGDSADLTRGSGVAQSDGDLWFWISEGVPGTEMPAFSSALSEEERWLLVNYIRQLQEAAREARQAEE